MSKLSNMQINEILTEFANNNPQIELTENRIQDIIDLFDRLMNEKVNQSKNLWEQEALVTDIAIGYSIGEDTDFIFRQHSDNKHMDFFDKFLNYGETKKIEKILKENNLPSSILKGLKPNQDIHLVTEYNGNRIEIIGKITFSPDGEEEQNDYLEIYINGKNIYFWERNAVDENVIFDDAKYDKNYKPEPKAPPLTKSGKPRKGIYLETVISSDGDNITIEKLKNGRTVYRASNGRFTKK